MTQKTNSFLEAPQHSSQQQFEADEKCPRTVVTGTWRGHLISFSAELYVHASKGNWEKVCTLLVCSGSPRVLRNR
ncbi:hypothetical protein BDA96_07G052600 [Sorghum bicolor]|uniref:Uncharacterized protein n=1 Tax=Sorghum bicolor TaxID=4558 RepID=A0A921QLB8_SORBI|nr:hypothetical protein BDA96_07G052600 [Sorghum bicolor]